MKTTFAMVKNELRLTEWSAQIQAQKSSGLTVHKWCEENGVNIKTYYYHLRKVREQCLETAQAIVPLTAPNSNNIHIEKNNLQISLPTDISPDLLLALVKELC